MCRKFQEEKDGAKVYKLPSRTNCFMVIGDIDATLDDILEYIHHGLNEHQKEVCSLA